MKVIDIFKSFNKLNIHMMLILFLIVFISCTPAPEDTILEGHVIDSETEEMLNNVTINVGNNGDKITDENGYYEFYSIVPGNHDVTTSKSGYKEQTKNVDVISEQTTTCDFALEKIEPTILKGKVTYNETGLSNVSIDLGTAGSDITDDNGNYEFIDISAGNYTIVVYKTGFEEQTQQINVIEEQTKDCDFIMEKLQITGTVRDAQTEQSLSNVTITTDPATQSKNTDALGNYEMDLNNEGTYTVIANKSEYVEKRVTVVVGRKSTVADINLEPEENIFLQIEAGPENNATVGEENVTFRWSSNGSVFEYKITNAEHIYPSEWTEIEEKSITFYDLDDTDEYYEFDLRVKKPEITEITSRRFKVNAISNNSIWLKHRKQIMNSSSSAFDIKVMVKEVSNLALVNVEIEFEKEKFELLSIRKETEFWKESDPDAEVIFLSSEISDANENSKLDFSIGLINTENYVANGSGTVATLQFIGRNFDGNIHNLEFTNQTKFRDANNEDIQINEKINAKIKLE